jgi:hypothetical protein
MRRLLAPVAALLLGCGSNDSETSAAGSGGGGASSECSPGEREVEGRGCVPAGVQDSGCVAGEVTLADGGCAPAGVPPMACAIGFEPDEDGCVPILPEEPCADGEMAIAGERQCRPVAPCPSGTWGDIPVESNTQYVDVAYAGNDSDGSALKPWTTIARAILEADDNAIVAIAAGSYLEDLENLLKPLRLWGRCPTLVEIVGNSGIATVLFGNGADGSEIRDVALRGATIGVGSAGGGNVLVDRVWIHDVGSYGMAVQSFNEPTELTMSRSLIERASVLGGFVVDANLVLDQSVVRATQPDAAFPKSGIGIEVDQRSGHASIQRSIIAGNRCSGIDLVGGNAVLEGSAVIDTQPAAGNCFGVGVEAQTGPSSQRAHLEVRASFVARNAYAGISLVGADGLIESSVVQDTRLDAVDNLGLGVAVSFDGRGSTATLRSSSIRGNGSHGIGVENSQAVVEGTVVRDHSGTQLAAGRGIELFQDVAPTDVSVTSSVVANSTEAGIVCLASTLRLEGVAVRDTRAWPATGDASGIVVSSFEARGTANIEASLIEHNDSLGLFVAGADATLEGVAVREQLPAPDGSDGGGIQVQWDIERQLEATMLLRDSIVEGNRDAGVLVFSAEASIEHSRIGDTAPEGSNGLMGDGMQVLSFADFMAPASARVTRSRFERAARAGIVCFSADLMLETTALECNAIDLAAEVWQGFQPSHESALQDLGGNVCGCDGQTSACKAISSQLAAPTPPGG